MEQVVLPLIVSDIHISEQRCSFQSLKAAFSSRLARFAVVIWLDDGPVE